MNRWKLSPNLADIVVALSALLSWWSVEQSSDLEQAGFDTVGV